MKIVVLLVLFVSSFSAFSQDWVDTYTLATVSSKEEKKPIVLVFSGSDWCAPCIKLNQSIWQSETFKAYSKENYILYKADFPRKKKNQLSANRVDQNATLVNKFNAKGHFPLVVVLDSNENVLGKIGYKKTTPKDFISLLNSCLK